MRQDHDAIYLNDGTPVRHSTAQRDYLCAECGGPLVTKCLDGRWLTVCANEADRHEGIVRKATWQYRQAARLQEAEMAREVYANLPDEVKRMLVL